MINAIENKRWIWPRVDMLLAVKFYLTPGGYVTSREMFLDEAKSTQWCKHVTGMSIIRQTDVFEQLSHRLSRVCHAWVSTRTQSITLYTRGWRARNVNSCECVFCPHPAKMWETLGFISREERSASVGTCKPATEGLVWVRRLTSWRMRKCATGWEAARRSERREKQKHHRLNMCVCERERMLLYYKWTWHHTNNTPDSIKKNYTSPQFCHGH